jgi:hypothetical protein
VKITARGLNRATLDRQMLLRRESLSFKDAVRRLVALQAQAAPSPYLALWNRLDGFDAADLDTAFANREVVKATLMRATLHAINGDDYQVFREAMEPTLRAVRPDNRFPSSGLTPAEVDALIPDLLEHAAQSRTSAEIEAWMMERLGAPPEPGAWRRFRAYAPLLSAPTGGPWSFGVRPSYVAAPGLPSLGDAEASAAALQTLVLRYLEGFGPASMADVAQFALVSRTLAKEALQALAGELERMEGPKGEVLYDIPDASRPDEETPAPPRLMAMWDSVLLAYSDRSRIIPPEYRLDVIRSNGDVLPTLLVDGYVAGVWRSVDGGIEATAFHHLPEDVWAGLSAEAEALKALLSSRQATIYSRHHNWWRHLPSAETRMLSRGVEESRSREEVGKSARRRVGKNG